MAVFCVLASVPASAIASPPDATTETATAVSYEEAILKGSVNPLGAATSYWFEYGETTSYGTKIPASPKSVGSGTSNVLVSNLVTGLKESTTYHFRVVAESKEGSTNGEDATFTTCGFNFSFGEKGSGEGQLSEPFGIAADSKGNIWVSDTGNNRIEEFNAEGKYLFQFGKKGTGNGEFKEPKGITISSSDIIWVVDSGNDRVQKFNTKGEYLFQFGKEGTGDGEFKGPQGFLMDEKARIWVADTGNNRIQKFNDSSFKFVDKFGEEGEGNGQFKSPIGIVSDFQEELWVADTGNDRAQKFNIEGEYLDKVGKAGAGAGQLIEPTAIVAYTPQKLLILDSGNDRVEAWKVKAESPKATTGGVTNVEVTTATVHATVNPRGLPTTYWFEYGETTSYGTKVPMTPKSVGEGLSGVSVEQALSGLKENTTYHFRVVAESEAGSSVGVDKSFKTLRRAITEPATTIKATQATLNGKVNPLGSATTYWFEYGKTTSYGTKIPVSPESAGSGVEYVAVSQTPTGLAEGTTYHFRVVAESEGSEAVGGGDKSFKTLKLPDAITEPATTIKATQATLNGKVNPLGSATTYWFEYGETESYGTKIPVSPESVGSGTEYVSVSKTPTGLKEVTTYHFRVIAESEAGKAAGADKSFTTAAGEVPSFAFAFGSEGTGEGQFQHPAEITVDTEGHLWVADKDNCRIEEFDQEGNFLFQFGEEGEEEGQLYGPKSLAIDAEGNIWVANGWSNRIEEFDSEGNFLFQFGEEGPEPGQFAGSGPESIAIDAEGNIWVVDTYNGRLQKFDPEGNLIEIVGSYGSEPGQLGEPTGIDIGLEGNIWVADWQNKRVSEFNEAGEFVRQFGKAGSGNGEFINPDTIEVDEAGSVWVLDEGNDRVQRFDEEGKYLGKFGSSGSGEGQFNFAWPTGITSDAEGNLWIADSGNDRVQKWIP